MFCNPVKIFSKTQTELLQAETFSFWKSNANVSCPRGLHGEMLSNSVINVSKSRMPATAGIKWVSEFQIKTLQNQNKHCDVVATHQNEKHKGVFHSDYIAGTWVTDFVALLNHKIIIPNALRQICVIESYHICTVCNRKLIIRQVGEGRQLNTSKDNGSSKFGNGSAMSLLCGFCLLSLSSTSAVPIQ